MAVTASPCTWSAVPNNAKLRRCTLNLTVGSRLPTTDLVTPTVFPRAPQGTTGILVFPFSAAGLGTPGGGATPNADWDNAPANLFNDFSGCSTSKTTDCYRSETFLAPLYGGETSEPRAVGFDVDKNAHTVSAYIVVAADLRDNPIRTLVVPPEVEDCGILQDFGTPDERIDRNSFFFQASNFPGIGERRSLCSFNLAALPLDADVRSATLGLYQIGRSDEIINGPVAVEHLVFGSLDVSDFALPALNIGIATLPTTDEVVLRVADVRAAVRDDLAAGRFRFQMRIRFALPPGGGVITESMLYYGPRGDVPPSLTLTYRRR